MTEITEKPQYNGHRFRDIIRRFGRHENAVLVVVLIALIGGFSVLSKGLTSSAVNMMNILVQSSNRGVAAVGQAFVILSAGIDVSVGGIGLFCSLLGVVLMTKSSANIIGYPVSTYTVVLLMLLAGTGWGVVNGSAVSRIGMPALIVTLAMWQITTGLGFQISGGLSIGELPDNLAFFGSGIVAGIPMPVIFFIVVAAVSYFVLNHTTFGRSVYATGGNEISAWLSGINVKKILLSVYVISGFLAGLTGVIMTSRVMSASMKTLVGLEIDSIAAVCVGGVSLVGGKGSLVGVVLGSLIIGVINNAMSVLAANPAVQRILKGAILFTAVAIDYIRRRSS
jgi:putative xylitol transport system permease protein